MSMKKSATAIAILLLAHYGILAHLVDVHFPNGEEIQDWLQGDIGAQNREAWETLYDPFSSIDERNEAVDTLVRNGEIS